MTSEEWLRGFEADDFDNVPYGCEYEFVSPNMAVSRIRPINLPHISRI